MSEDILKRVPHQILEEAQKAGMTEVNRSGSLFHVDQSTIYSQVNEYFEDKLELMDTKNALREYPWLEDYRWKLVDPEVDEYTRRVHQDFSGGYFIRIKAGAEITFPLQSCLMIMNPTLEQRVHNIIIAEEGSKSNIITSCVQHGQTRKGAHLGVTEVYIKEEAELNYTMIHHWGEETKVRPRSATRIEEGGEFVSNYICLRPVKDVQMYPAAYCEGDGSKASFNSILYGHHGSGMDIGTKAVLNGRGSSAEMITRAIAERNSRIIVRGLIEGRNQSCRGHLECRGLLVDDEAYIQSIPELIALKRGAEITHEAAVGEISEQKILYLMTRGLDRDTAISTIIRGFMDVGIMGLPKNLSNEINRIIDLAAEAS
ncbi:MAG: SufD family Fe-S cluster assembly protein [Candidatus Bathyarchaeia archaeon]